MRVFLDQQPCDIEAETVADAIAGAADRARAQGRVVTDVTVDGCSWSEENIASARQRQIVAEEVCLSTAEPAQLVGETFDDAIVALDQANAAQQEAADLLESGRQNEAMEKLTEALTVWQNVQQAVALGTELLELHLDAEGETPARKAIDRLNEQLKLVRAAISGNDPVGLTDSLRYDMPEVTRLWRELLEDLRLSIGEGNT